ncbi:MAG TPA: ABC transporter permease, partial [Myxococcaceae bacterium]|nr:ABC transporter permease [Myxococcaceae bacterium]
MGQAERQTTYQWGRVGSGAVLALLGAGAMLARVDQLEAWPDFTGNAVFGLVGWGVPLLILKGVVLLLQLVVTGTIGKVAPPSQLGLIGLGLWVAGWGFIASGIRRTNLEAGPRSEASGAKLFPGLKGYKDFYWSTLLFYGGGILLAELALIFLQTALAGGVRVSSGGSAQAQAQGFSLSPPMAFTLSGTVACVIAFGAGFLGAARARRLSAPEATIGLVYFGVPVPLLLTLMGVVPELQMSFGYRLREVVYLASQLGDRAELGYWLGFFVLVLMMVLGITSGFVATGSGRLETRLGFELFVARRHVQVFRPRLLVGLAVVLLLGIIPPIIIYAIVRAAEAAVERTRIRTLGMQDPLKATAALNDWKSREQ